MRSIDKGEAPRQYKDYAEAKRDLGDRIGHFCSYCERVLSINGAIEHIQPKSLVPSLKLEWENFLLSCPNCNSTKGDTDINADNINDYVWPDTDDTYHLVEYDPVTAMPHPASDLPQDLAEKVQRLISLVGLDKPQPKVGTVAYNKCADRRVESRLQVLDLAKKYHSILLSIPESPARTTLIEAVIELSKAYGHWSLWMHTFEDIPEVRTLLLDSIPGTRKDSFTEE